MDRAKSRGDGRRQRKRHRQGLVGLIKYLGFQQNGDGNPLRGVKQRRDVFKSDPAMWAWEPEKEAERLVKRLF